MILDFPGEDEKKLAEYFCYNINGGSFGKIRFSFSGMGKSPRVILTGDTAGVMRLVNGYMREHHPDEA